MAKKIFEQIESEHRSFIERQHIFFVATAASEGRVNVAPKGMDTLRVVGPNRIVWLNLTGSENETAAHLAEVPRMTLMWCSFDRTPLILRAYGVQSPSIPAMLPGVSSSPGSHPSLGRGNSSICM